MKGLTGPVASLQAPSGSSCLPSNWRHRQALAYAPPPFPSLISVGPTQMLCTSVCQHRQGLRRRQTSINRYSQEGLKFAHQNLGKSHPVSHHHHLLVFASILLTYKTPPRMSGSSCQPHAFRLRELMTRLGPRHKRWPCG